MKIALDWIAQYLDRNVTATDAREALLNAGLPVESVTEAGDTLVLDVEVTSNRADCLCHWGLARELAALLRRKFTLPEIKLRESGRAVGELTQVEIRDMVGCPRYVARVLTGIRVGPSPAWLKNALESVGQRSINNVVDVTNYVLMETGQPLHAFDLDRLEGRRIVVRRAEAGEKIVTIDGQTRSLTPSILVIADGQSPVAVAGIMGGKDAGVTDSTVNVLLESARFDPLTIRHTARALSLSSESSYRFERGIDPAVTELASQRAAQLILEVAGGELATGACSVGAVGNPLREVQLRAAQVKRIVGVAIPTAEMHEILTRLDFSPRFAGEDLWCVVPSHRPDVTREIDLIEEICRVWGYGRIPVDSQITHALGALDQVEEAGRVIRSSLAAAGWSEAITFSFVDAAEANLFLGEAVGTPVRVSDAVRKVSNTLRPSILPGLLHSRRHNENNGQMNACLFESASVFFQAAGGPREKPFEEQRLALVGETVGQVLGGLEMVIQRLHPQAVLRTDPKDFLMFADGAGGELRLRRGDRPEEVLGCVGMFSPAVQEYYDLKNMAAGAEVRWSGLVDLFEPVRKARPLPRFPAVQRDLSVVVDETVRWGGIQKWLESSSLEFLESTEFVGVFRGKPVGDGKKSVTMAMIFRNPEATLRSQEVDLQIKRAVEVLQERCGATLRV